MLRKAHTFGYTTEVLKVTDMLQNADNKLFSLMFRSSHCLHTLLPDLKVIDIVLRNSGTSFNLPHCSYKQYKQSFVNRRLFRDCYWHVLLCGTYMLFDLICYHFSPHNWMAFVRLNKRHVMLCYVMLCFKWGETMRMPPCGLTSWVDGLWSAPILSSVGYA